VARASALTFQKSARARRFYERRDFVLIRETDGAGNEEKESDALLSLDARLNRADVRCRGRQRLA
jgi:hypothetical protein